jgi:hypothetical protein
MESEMEREMKREGNKGGTGEGAQRVEIVGRQVSVCNTVMKENWSIKC